MADVLIDDSKNEDVSIKDIENDILRVLKENIRRTYQMDRMELYLKSKVAHMEVGVHRWDIAIINLEKKNLIEKVYSFDNGKLIGYTPMSLKKLELIREREVYENEIENYVGVERIMYEN